MNSGVLDKWCFAFPVSARSAVAQQIKALATPGPSSAVFFAAYLVSEAQGVALESIWKSPLQKTCLENVKAAINFHCFIHHDHVQVTLGQTCNYPNVYAKNLEHVEYFVGTHTHIVNFNRWVFHISFLFRHCIFLAVSAFWHVRHRPLLLVL